MSILSFSFAFLFFLFFLLYYTAFRNYQWIVILVASILFYCSYVPMNFIVPATLILMNYFLALLFEKMEGNKKRLLLAGAIGINVAMLIVFKMFNGVIVSLPTVDFTTGLDFSLIMPLGISFFTFSSISYLVDVKRGKLAAEKNLGLLATNFFYFPKISQGPIERSGSFLQKIAGRHDLVPHHVFDGMKLIAWGLFKKLVVADRLSVAVSQVYDHPGNYHGFQFLVASLFFSVQIYADFSGFIDIARGISSILGIELSRNFNLPYFSRSIRDFWSRWHMTLSLWLRDYIFLPLSYSLSGKLKKERYLFLKTEMWIYIIATVITFAICGIWHGSGLNFLAWGLLFAFYLVISRLTSKMRKRNRFLAGFRKWTRINNFLAVTWTFLLVSFAWIFFRANSFHEALFIAGQIFSFLGEFLASLFTAPATGIRELAIKGIGLTKADMIIIACSVPFLFLVEFLSKDGNVVTVVSSKPVYVRWSFYYVLLFVIVYFGEFSQNHFIYDQF